MILTQSDILTSRKTQITFCNSNNHTFCIIYTMQMHFYTTVITYTKLFCTRTDVNFTLWDAVRAIGLGAYLESLSMWQHKSSTGTKSTVVDTSQHQFIIYRWVLCQVLSSSSVIFPSFVQFGWHSGKYVEYWVHREQSVRPGAVIQTGWWIKNHSER